MTSLRGFSSTLLSIIHLIKTSLPLTIKLYLFLSKTVRFLLPVLTSLSSFLPNYFLLIDRNSVLPFNSYSFFVFLSFVFLFLYVLLYIPVTYHATRNMFYTSFKIGDFFFHKGLGEVSKRQTLLKEIVEGYDRPRPEWACHIRE